ncbi:MAG: 50S ribosomal protein L13 [Clostridiales bacterium]|nr:50S ribosomal protein L13 [Clostridiales bacterium]MCC8098461.1 50S ribosomal protein L13 [Clostridiales bacterium]MCD7857891.1 50S ribosomal protein L13 [Clostridiales bacterium]MCD7919817.1 50S ribosomal protein L13 [Clostridiales bacterium]MCD8086879.1 50S ribosomal protein L13 [Clostridiales bacterium]
MSTYMAKTDVAGRKWYVLDAAGKPLGKTAVAAADLLRGKNKPEYTPHVDCGDFVIVINSDKAVLTGKKATQKYYRHHSGWTGGLKEIQYGTMMAKRSDFVMELAVKGMLPKNSLGAKALTRLRVYKGAEHEQAAQKPIAVD